MKNFKNTNFIKALCMLFVVAIWNVSCSKEALEAKCSELKSPITNSTNIPDRLENMLELVRTLDRTNNYNNAEEFHADLYGQSTEAIENLAFISNEMELYGQLGYSSYMDKQLTDEIISTNVHKEFIDFETSVEKFINMEPSLEDFTGFISTMKSGISGKNLCKDEKKLMSDFYDLVLGTAQYYYKHYAIDGKISTRGCGFFKGLLCAALALVVVLIGTVAGILLFVGAIIVVDGDEKGEIDGDQAGILGLALGIYLGFNFFKWCCQKDEVPVQQCEPPVGGYLKPTDCMGTFSFTIYGPSNYANTEWTNSNITPENFQTQTPSATMQVIDPNELMTLHADIACVENGTTAVLYTWDDEPDFEIPGGNVTLEWITLPPSTAPQNSNYTLKVTTPNGVPYQYNWGITNDNSISGGGNTVNVNFFTKGYANITLKVTNTCTNEIQFLSEGTYVY